MTLQNLFEHSEIHPRNLAVEVVYRKYTKGFGIMDEEYGIKEELLLQQELKGGCGKTAVVLPFEDSVRYVNVLKGQGVTLTISKDTCDVPETGFYLNGMVSPIIHKNIGLLSQSGISGMWRHLLAYLTESRGSVQDPPPPRAAGFDGNIVIIFSVLVAGLVISIFMAALEIVFGKNETSRSQAGNFKNFND